MSSLTILGVNWYMCADSYMHLYVHRCIHTYNSTGKPLVNIYLYNNSCGQIWNQAPIENVNPEKYSILKSMFAFCFLNHSHSGSIYEIR